MVRYGDSVHGLTVLIVHLALSRARACPTRFISELINSERHVILMAISIAAPTARRWIT